MTDDLERHPGEEEKEHRWMPKWIVKVDGENKIGVTIDDGCYLFLVRKVGGHWSPTKWVPKEAAMFVWDLEKGAKITDLQSRLARYRDACDILMNLHLHSGCKYLGTCKCDDVIEARKLISESPEGGGK